MTVLVWRGLILHHASCILQVCESVVCQIHKAVPHASQSPFQGARADRRFRARQKRLSSRRPRQLRKTRLGKAATATLTVNMLHQQRIPLPRSLQPMAVRRR